jgi:putative transcription factor
MECEMCGKNDTLFKTEIEGTTLNICANCSKYGKVISRAKTKYEIKTENKIKKTAEEAPLETVAENYAEIVKKKRESLKLKQEELAKMINEKESVIHHIESSASPPSITTARKLEKALHIKLVELEIPAQMPQNKKGNSEGMTIGDIIKIRQK